ncbi:PTS sugar transporter subunit IIA [Ottowia pentelensis]|uniref:PTS sugar transporter subunit IIA n=1 Tax=Ottowia pentelensis TaxID=511108 RepID=A0ABV6PNI7_9BURK
MNAVLVIAHAPLASALREAALHMLADCAPDLQAVDVRASDAPEASLADARAALARCAGAEGVLILADVLGATPCNVATRLLAGERTRLVAGVNLPMLLRSLCYRHEPLAALTQRALAGGASGVVEVPARPADSPARPTAS